MWSKKSADKDGRERCSCACAYYLQQSFVNNVAEGLDEALDILKWVVQVNGGQTDHRRISHITLQWRNERRHTQIVPTLELSFHANNTKFLYYITPKSVVDQRNYMNSLTTMSAWRCRGDNSHTINIPQARAKNSQPQTNSITNGSG